MFTCTPDDLDMHVVYDVSHNIAKVRMPPLPRLTAPGLRHSGAQVEEHVVDGRVRTLLVHRKVRLPRGASAPA